jgi:Domain of unknown function (DUF6457)
MNDDERTALNAWITKLSSALNVNDIDLDLDQVLDLAGDAARAVLRPAAPLTTFLVGYAAGRAVGGGAESEPAIRDAIFTAAALASAG